MAYPIPALLDSNSLPPTPLKSSSQLLDGVNRTLTENRVLPLTVCEQVVTFGGEPNESVLEKARTRSVVCLSNKMVNP
jgi:hypothetical protein